MGAPRGKGFELFIRSTPLSDAERLLLIEARKEMLVPHFRNTTFPELGSLKCLTGGIGGKHAIADDEPEVDEESLVLKTQGIFRDADVCYEEGTMRYLHIWGLLRSGDWVLGKLTYNPGYELKQRYEKAVRISMHTVSLENMLRWSMVMPDTVWFQLARVVSDLVTYRKAGYDLALELQHTIQMEEKALNLLNARLRNEKPAPVS